MIIIYGHRAFGRVDAHGGEHVQTSFAHIYYMPLFPTSSFWVTQDLGNAARGFTINWSGKSIVAAYLRSWGPIAALAAFAGGGALGVILALSFVGLTGWAWSLRSLRGATALRRSDFNLLSFGTRCDPARLDRDTRASMKTMLDQRWTELGATRPPDDVAKYGAMSVSEAAVAYGLLRLAAIERRPGAAEAADRIFNGTHEPLPVGDGPYRGDDHAPARGLLEQVASRAAAVRPAPVPGPWWTMKRKAVLAGVLGLAALGGVLQESPSLLGVRTLTAHDLAYARTGEEIVAVRCDSLEPVGDFESNPSYACMIGDKMLPVIGKLGHDVEAPGGVVTGRIHAIRTYDTEWPDELRYSDQVFQAYLRVTSRRQSQVAAIICIVVLALVGGFAVRWTYGWWKSRGKAKPNV